MNKRDMALAFLIATIWGGNFTVIKIGLHGVPPMLLAALRYIFTALPIICFIRKPAIEWRYILAYGLTIGFGQFACLFYAMTIGMPAGIASMILQSQAFFTIIFAFLLLREPVKAQQMLGFFVAFLGLYYIGGINDINMVFSIPGFALFLTVAAAAFWGISNIVVKLAAHKAASRGEKLDTLSLVAWSSLVPPLPLLAMALLMDSPATLWSSLTHIKGSAIFSIAYLAYGGTILGSTLWSRLLTKNPAGSIAPFSLLIPISGLLIAQIVLGERLSVSQWLGSAIILLGLIICNTNFPALRIKLSGRSRAPELSQKQKPSKNTFTSFTSAKNRREN